MNIEFPATVAVMAPDPINSLNLYVETLGLPLQGDGCHHSEQIACCKSFGIWPLSQAAQACFGTEQWPTDRSVPQISIEFDVADAAMVVPATRELEQAGCMERARSHGVRPSLACGRQKARSSASPTRPCCMTDSIPYGSNSHTSQRKPTTRGGRPCPHDSPAGARRGIV
jgi:hypothetical protein